MSHDTTQPSLLRKLRKGADAQAWREFEAKYRNLVVGYCRRRGLQPADCDDVQQLVWMNLAKGLQNFEYDPRRGRFRDYLRRVVRAAIARHFSRPNPAGRALDTTMLAITPNGTDEFDEAWEAEWVDHHYRLAMQTVRSTFDPRSIAIFDRLLAGEPVATLATAFATTDQAIHKIKQRIRNRLAQLIDRQIRAEDGRAAGGIPPRDPGSIPSES
ncbi:MAG TPA: sigma-70 family RNA polymerase sigma factor [Phycisphaerae bacterium]|nr:sigma-70 family RNA polymerase sigma factor [Phycisphaerales bacterium]HRX86967.1 sigma-70 family RNA polymerase sigma factor [Phycisphaerae bacterium]